MVNSEEKVSENDLAFARKVYQCIELLGGQSDILSAIGSWRNDATDEQTFELLDAWIEATIKERQNLINDVIRLHNK